MTRMIPYPVRFRNPLIWRG